MDGEYITALRTAAGSRAVHARARARGCVACSPSSARASRRARTCGCCRWSAPFAEIRLVARDPARRASGSGVPAGDVEGADVICLTTSSSTPVLRAGDVAPGTHVTSVGYAPPGGELDPDARRARRGCSSRRARRSRRRPAGCAELAGLDRGAARSSARSCSGRAPGRTSRDEITVYKAMGHIAEDAAAAELVYARRWTRAADHVDL